MRRTRRTSAGAVPQRGGSPTPPADVTTRADAAATKSARSPTSVLSTKKLGRLITSVAVSRSGTLIAANATIQGRSPRRGRFLEAPHARRRRRARRRSTKPPRRARRAGPGVPRRGAADQGGFIRTGSGKAFQTALEEVRLPPAEPREGPRRVADERAEHPAHPSALLTRPNSTTQQRKTVFTCRASGRSSAASMAPGGRLRLLVADELLGHRRRGEVRQLAEALERLEQERQTEPARGREHGDVQQDHEAVARRAHR